jgi:hypothetical protein
MHTTKLLIFLAVWKRPEITEICFMGVDRLRKSGLFPIEAFAVISEALMVPLCRKYEIDFCLHENLPLGKKKNFGLQQAMKKDFDYMIEIGSDDLLKTELLEAYAPYFGHKHLIGLNSFYFLNAEDGACRRYSNPSLYGMGRAVSRYALEQTGELWRDDLNKGLDNYSTAQLIKKGFTDVRIKEPLAIDIKSDINIWPFNYLNGKQADFEEVVQGLSAEEVKAIKSLQHAEVEN